MDVIRSGGPWIKRLPTQTGRLSENISSQPQIASPWLQSSSARPVQTIASYGGHEFPRQFCVLSILTHGGVRGEPGDTDSRN